MFGLCGVLPLTKFPHIDIVSLSKLPHIGILSFTSRTTFSDKHIQLGHNVAYLLFKCRKFCFKFFNSCFKFSHSHHRLSLR